MRRILRRICDLSLSREERFVLREFVELTGAPNASACELLEKYRSEYPGPALLRNDAVFFTLRCVLTTTTTTSTSTASGGSGRARGSRWLGGGGGALDLAASTCRTHVLEPDNLMAARHRANASGTQEPGIDLD